MGYSSLGVLVGGEIEQVAEKLKTRIESLGGVDTGKVRIECKLFLRSDHNPTKVFSAKFMESHTKTFYTLLNRQILKTNTEMEGLFERFKAKNGLYTERKTIYIEGPRYDFGDFRVNLGTVIFNGSAKTLFLEVEYKPCSSMSQCKTIVEEFSTALIPAGLKWTYNQHHTEPTQPASEPSSPIHHGTHNAVIDEEGAAGDENIDDGPLLSPNLIKIPDYDFSFVNLSADSYSNRHMAYQYLALLQSTKIL